MNIIFLIFNFLYVYIRCFVNDVGILKSNIRSLRRLSKDFVNRGYGNSYQLNYYYTSLYLGKDRQRQTYILDTGSGITTSPCSECKKCGKHINKPYKLDDNSKVISCPSDECSLVRSSCQREKKCGFSIGYLEGSSINGFYFNEEISLGDENSKLNQSYYLPIGCTTSETHLFLTQLADGIMGLCNERTSFVSMLKKKHVIDNNIFSLCFNSDGGYFSFGEINSDFHKKNSHIFYIPLINKGGHNFNFQGFSLSINNIQIQTSAYGFLDSGTTITYFPKEIYSKIEKEIFTHCKKVRNCGGSFVNVQDYGPCIKFKGDREMMEGVRNWPGIVFHMKNNGEKYDYVWTPENYYFNYTKDGLIHGCFGFEGEGTSKITLGSTFFHGHDIIFDSENNRVGFIEADCSRGRAVSEFRENITIVEEDINKIVSNPSQNNTQSNIFSRSINNKIVLIFAVVILISLLLLLIYASLDSVKKCFKKSHGFAPQLDIEQPSAGNNNSKISGEQNYITDDPEILNELGTAKKVTIAKNIEK